MKKKYLFLAALTFFVFSVCYSAVLSNSSFATTYIAKADVVVSYGDTIKCQTNGDVDEQIVEMVEAELNKIPSKIREKFVQSGWHIYVTDESLAKAYYNGIHKTVYGVTFYEKKLILIDNSLEAASTATIHEVGHWFDNYFGNISNTKEFNAIYNKENEKFLNTFSRGCKMDIGEYFAESFYRYIVSPDAMKKVAPETYLFIQAYANTMQT